MKQFASLLTHTLRRWNLRFLAAAIVLGMTTCCLNAVAQSGAGSIQGTVMDTTHAVIPRASINVVNQATSVAINTKSNDVGFYQVPGLFAATYVVTVSAPNMKTYTTTLQLLVAQNAVINPVMTAGAVTQQVEVTGNEVQLTTTDNGTIGSTLENSRINQLPMNGRFLYTLAGMTTPGLEGNGQRANGLLQQALEYVADGAPLDNRQLGNMTQASLPDPDSVQEVQIQTNDSSALYSTPGTAVITTKSGSNALHGTFFETARNNAIGIAKARQDPSNFSAPHYVRNEFGASAGGPIIIPKVYHGKDRSFWFFAYERYSLSQASTILATVPTPAMRGGDFSGLINGEGLLQVLYDPSTTQPSTNCAGSPNNPNNQYCRTPFPNNQIPIGRISPTAKTLFDITPTPTTPDNPLIQSNIQGVNPNFTVIPTITFRLDQVFNENNRAYLRFTNNLQTQHALRNYPKNNPATIAADGFPAGASGLAYNPAATFSTALGYTHVFSPSFFSEAVLSQQWYSQQNYAGGTPFANFDKKLGLPNNFGEPGFPGIGSNLIYPYFTTQFIYGMSQIITNLDENLTKTVGKHQMQFGGRYRHERMGTLPDESPDAVSFGPYSTGLEDPSTGKNYGVLPNTGNQNGDFFLGSASSYTVRFNPPYTHFHDMEFDAYFQDNYHVSRNLTANIGVRWESHPAVWVKYGMANAFDLKNDAQVTAVPPAKLISEGFTTQAVITNLENLGVKFETPAEAGYPSALMKSYNLNFSPRLGIAYQPFGGKYGTVIRGAYGRYIYPIPARNSVKNELQNEPFEDAYSQSYMAANQSPDGLPSYLLRAPQPVVMGVNSANVVDSTTTNAITPGFTLWTFAPNYAPNFVTQMNATLEQPLKGNSALRVSWVWTHAANLDHPYYYNTHPSNFTWEMKTGTIPPTGGASVIGTPQQNTYAATALGPYDQAIYSGGNLWQARDGWSNDNALQVNYQRLYHSGFAYQLSYVWSKPLRLGGNSSRDGLVYTAASYLGTSGNVGTMTSPFGTVISPVLPPARPAGIAPYADWKGLARWEQYNLDSAIPLHHITFNGIADLPFGRGKRFLGNSNRLMNEVIGGWQLAGDGSIATEVFQPSSGNWGPTNPIKVYKHNARITDCRSGVCYKAFEWFNGYVPSTVINAATKGLSGLPSGYVPFRTPVDTTPGTTNYGNNNVQVTAPSLNNGQPVTIGFSPGSYTNPFSHTFLNGPINYTVDLSVFKVFPVTESTDLRFNMDAFNALNVQGYNNPNGGDGVENMLSSHNTPRQLQFTMRFTF